MKVRRLPSALAVGADDSDNDDDNWDLDGRVGLDDVKGVGVNSLQSNFQDSYRDKKCKVLQTNAEAFDQATPSINKYSLVDADP